MLVDISSIVFYASESKSWIINVLPRMRSPHLENFKMESNNQFHYWTCSKVKDKY